MAETKPRNLGTAAFCRNPNPRLANVVSNPNSFRLYSRRFGHGDRGDGEFWERTDFLHGRRRSLSCIVRKASVAVQLFQTAVRSSDKSADRPPARRDGDVADDECGSAGQFTASSAGKCQAAKN